MLILNYLVNQLEHVWTRQSFVGLVVFTSLWTSAFRLLGKVITAAIFENSNRIDPDLSILAQPYCSINHLIILVLMGCRQSYPERQLDTFIPFVT